MSRLITRLWTAQPGDWFCVSTRHPWHDYFFGRGELDDIGQLIDKCKRVEDVYFCPHGFSRRGRKKEHAVLPRMLWADLDEVDPDAITFTPTIAIQSSPGRYVGLWLTDATVSADLNRRMTYHVEADRGGWDLTQVLRMPGTINHKYPDKPKVMTLWMNGPRYRLADLERELPRVAFPTQVQLLEVNPYAHNWREVIGRLKVPAGLVSDPYRGEDRSNRYWRLGKTLQAQGATADEVAAVIWNSVPWVSKTEGMRDDVKREKLAREISRMFGKAGGPNVGPES